MKTIIHFLLSSFLFVFVLESATAQQVSSSVRNRSFKKGTEQITLSYGYGQGYLVQNRNVIQLQAGYYVTNRLLVGLIGSVAREWVGDLHSTNDYCVGPLLRYQFRSGRLSPFAEVAYLFGQPTPTNHHTGIFTTGLSFGLLPRLRLEASYRFIIVPLRESGGQPQLGVSFLLGAKG